MDDSTLCCPACRYDLVLRGGGEGHPDESSPLALSYDGIFVDNVFMTQSWAKSDIYGNPFYPDTTGTGKVFYLCGSMRVCVRVGEWVWVIACWRREGIVVFNLRKNFFYFKIREK